MPRPLAILLLLLLPLHPLFAQQSAPASQPASSQPASAPATAPATAPAQAPATAPASAPAGPAVPLAEIVSQSESTLASLRAAATQLTTDPVVASVSDDLPNLTRDIDARLDDAAKVLAARPSLDTLRTAESAWSTLAQQTAEWKTSLTTRVASLDSLIASLQSQSDTWRNTLALAQAGNAPPEIIDRINATLKAIADTLKQAQAVRTNVLRLQAQVAQQDARIATALADVDRVRDQLFANLFVQDSPAIWSTQVTAAAPAASQPANTALLPQITALREYVHRQAPRMAVHLLLLALILTALFWARHSFDTWVADEPTLSPAKPVFASPIATAVILSLFLSIWLHPQAPRFFWTCSGLISILPATLLIRRLIEPRFHEILYALITFYLLDLLREIIAGLNVWPRYSLLVETCAAIAILIHFLRSRPQPVTVTAPPAAAAEALSPAAPSVAAPAKLSRSTRRRRSALNLIFRLAFLACSVSVLANLFGFVALATFIAHSLFRSAYIAIIFYAGVAVADGLVIVLLHIGPIHRLAAVKNHASLIRARCRRFIGWAFFILWLYVFVGILNIRPQTHALLHFLLTTPFGLGPLTLADILKGIITVWAAFALSRFIRFLLQEDVYPHVRLPRGLGTAVSSVLHYLILVFGFMTALAFLGFPLSQLTILTGAFGVGLGFGLQTIINNFFSGLIVLFERPVQVGDVIEMDALVGTITRIGIRASIIRTQAGSDIIMPNSRLVAEKVINWSLSDRCRGFEIPFTLDASANAPAIARLLEDTARSVPHIAANPAPVAQFTGFSGPNPQLTLRAWTDDVENYLQIKSNLGLTLLQTLTTQKIPLK